jgi:hypothetical protein
MSWQVEITSIVRQLIGDAVAPYTFSDSRLQGTIVVAAQLVNQEVAFLNTYTIDIPNSGISPDPTSIPEHAFTNLVSFRTACLIDGSTFRTKAAQAGISVKTGSHSISTGGQLDGYKYLLEHGPCKVYAEAKWEYETSNSNAGRAILGPFAGINFDSSYPWGPTDGHTKRYF